MKTLVRKWSALALALLMALALVSCGASDTAEPFDPSTLLEGKLISVIGDSISTFDTVNNNPSINPTLADHAVYYTAGRYDMTVSDTWWQQTADALGAEILVNNSWSGSCVLLDNKGPDSASYGIRAENLHDTQGREPDMVFIYMGTNDFDAAKDAFGTPETIDYNNLLRADGSHDTPETFCQAYALMLAKVKNRYPNAEIYCLNILDRRSLMGDKTEIDAFNGYIETIAAASGAILVDIYRESGITADRISCATHIADEVLHPSIAGMDAISGCLLSAIYENSKYMPETLSLCHVTYQLDKVTVTEGTQELVPLGSAFSCSFFDGLSVNGIEVSVKMNGKDITDQCVENGKVNITNVTGDIEIIAEK